MFINSIRMPRRSTKTAEQKRAAEALYAKEYYRRNRASLLEKKHDRRRMEIQQVFVLPTSFAPAPTPP